MPTFMWPVRKKYHSPGDEPSLNLPSIERYCSRARMKPNKAPAKMNPERAMISARVVKKGMKAHKGRSCTPFESR